MAVDMNRDDAVRVVAEAMESCCEQCALDPDQGVWRDATRAVAALVAAGWGDLAAERERLAGAVEHRCRFNKHEWDRGGSMRDVCPSCGAAARLIRETPEEGP